MMVRDGESDLPACLDRIADYCDTVYALDDRSCDRTGEILRNHPIISNLFSAPAAISKEAWFYSEATMLELLYRMADLYQPDWIAMIDVDVTVECGPALRDILSAQPPDVAGVRVLYRSRWNDPQFPLMVPLMGRAESLQGDIWRYYPGLRAGKKRLHNCRLPENITDYGRVATSRDIVFGHRGWETLKERIVKVDMYTALDPEFRLNDGVRYDEGLLFGYRRDRVADLIREYERRYQSYIARHEQST